MIEPQIIHARPDYTYNLLTEMKEFYNTELVPAMEKLGVRKNPYPVSDPRYNWWNRERHFWQTNNQYKNYDNN